jgi:hypothetical protein
LLLGLLLVVLWLGLLAQTSMQAAGHSVDALRGTPALLQTPGS